MTIFMAFFYLTFIIININIFIVFEYNVGGTVVVPPSFLCFGGGGRRICQKVKKKRANFPNWISLGSPLPRAIP